MPINFAALRGEVDLNAVPDDGPHQARLERLALVSGGEQLVADWSDAANELLTWTSWFRFDAIGMSYTREFLLGLGIDLAALMDEDALEMAIIEPVGHFYNVHTESTQGKKGDRWFTNTKIDGRAHSVQTGMAFTPGEMPPPEEPAAPEPEDDIPF